MHRIIAAALVAAAPPLAAGAQGCPTNSDLEDGIRLTRLGPQYFSLAYQQADLLTEYARYAAGEPEIIAATYTHPLAERSIGPLASDSPQFLYDQDTRAIDDLAQTRSWVSTGTVKQGDALERPIELSLELSGLGSAMIGACEYVVWRVEKTLKVEGVIQGRLQQSYAPNLGLVIGSIRLGPDGQPQGSVFFDEITAH